MSTERPTETTLPRRIADLDGDAFFASVDLLRGSQLKGVPVVIGGGRRCIVNMLAPRIGERPDLRMACEIGSTPQRPTATSWARSAHE